jgi:hypothetical protein
MINSPDSNKPAFFTIPYEIIEIPGLTLGYLKVFETIYQFLVRKLPCFLSEAAICERTGLGRSQVYEALNFLEKHKCLMRTHRNGKRYFVLPSLSAETDCTTNEPPSGGADVDVRPSGQSVSGGADHNKDLNINKDLKELLIKQNKQPRPVDKSKSSPPQTIVKPPVVVFSDPLKNTIHRRLRTKHLPSSPEIVEQIEFYVLKSKDKLTVDHAINIAMKLLAKGEWRIPGGMTVQIKKQEKKEQEQKQKQYHADAQGFRALTKAVAGGGSLEKMKQEFRNIYSCLNVTPPEHWSAT